EFRRVLFRSLEARLVALQAHRPAEHVSIERRRRARIGGRNAEVGDPARTEDARHRSTSFVALIAPSAPARVATSALRRPVHTRTLWPAAADASARAVSGT